ncbi:hypothetical protein PMAYCL1PPCAC_06496, partial [Pristionchus mayeri]
RYYKEAQSASLIDMKHGPSIGSIRIVTRCSEHRHQLLLPEEIVAVHHHLVSPDDEFDSQLSHRRME